MFSDISYIREEQDSVERISVKDRVYEEVLAHILNGDYPANTILNEKDLIEKYSASKTTVRYWFSFAVKEY